MGSWDDATDQISSTAMRNLTTAHWFLQNLTRHHVIPGNGIKNSKCIDCMGTISILDASRKMSAVELVVVTVGEIFVISSDRNPIRL